MALSLNIPSSASTVSVSIIDTVTRVEGFPLSQFAGPTIEGFETFGFGINTFLITHGDQNLLFDLGLAKEWETDYPPAAVEAAQALKDIGATIQEGKYVSEILTDASVPLDSINAIIWSHSHWDHTGRPSLFPSSADLIVGPGVLETFGQGYPTNETSPYLARELEGRTVTTVDFAPDSVTIGGLQAYDYFGDGSFYLLDAPGHEIGHLVGLARVTSNPDTFILMGADSFHHASELRPSSYVPLPESICLADPPQSYPKPLPGELLHAIHPSHDLESLPPYAANLTSPTKSAFLAIVDPPEGVPNAQPANGSIARDVLTKIQAFDADDRIFIVGAHDLTLQGLVDFFPASANEWKVKGWKEKARWQFLADFEDALHLGPISRVRRGSNCS